MAPPETGPHRAMLLKTFLLCLPRLLAIAFVVAASVLTLVYAGGYAAFGPDTTKLRHEISVAFEQGALPRETTDVPDRTNGSLTYNDCLILIMAANTTQPRLRKTITPAAIESVNDRALDSNTCGMLFSYVVDQQADAFRSWPYHRYVSAFVVPVAVLVPGLGVSGTRALLKSVNYAMVFGIGILSAVLIGRRRSCGAGASLPLIGGCILSAMLIGFFGMEFYSQNLSIGLAEPVMFALLAAFILGRPLEWPLRRFAVIVAVAFGFITSLEFWTGQLPFTTAAGLGLLGLHISRREDIPRALQRGLCFLTVAGATVAFTFGLKIAVASLVFSENVMGNFVHQLEVRVGDGQFGLVKLILHLAGRADHIGQGSLTLGLLNGLVASLMLTVAAWRVLLPRQPDTPGLAVARARLGFLLTSVAVVVIWHLMFRNHSTIHSEFMVRTFSWVWAAGWISMAIARRLRQPATTWSSLPLREAHR